MPDNRVPQFCSVCGARLVPDETTTGYDVYTGEPVKDHSLRCPNPTVTNTSTLGITRVTKTQHPRWELTNGTWAVA